MSILAYNVFAVSVLSYVAQLEGIPKYVLDCERAQVLQMFRGPGNWAIPEDLWFGRESFGLAKSALSIELMARAAKFRMATMGCRLDGGQNTIRGVRRHGINNISSRWGALQTALSSTDFPYRAFCWSEWYKNCYCKVLLDNVHWLGGKGITFDKILCDVVPSRSG